MKKKAKNALALIKRLYTAPEESFAVGQWVYYVGRHTEDHGWHKLESSGGGDYPLKIKRVDTFRPNADDGSAYSLLHTDEAAAFGLGKPPEPEQLEQNPMPDKAPVKCWENGGLIRFFGFHDAENECVFSPGGERNGFFWDNIEPVPLEAAHQVWGGKEAYEAALAQLKD